MGETRRQVVEVISRLGGCCFKSTETGRGNAAQRRFGSAVRLVTGPHIAFVALLERVLNVHISYSCETLTTQMTNALLRRAAGDSQHLTVDPSAVLTGKECNHPRYILRHSTSSQRAVARHQALDLVRWPVRRTSWDVVPSILITRCG